MKLRLSDEDMKMYKEKYADLTAAAGFAEEPKFIGLANYYVVILDEEKITLVQTDMGFNEKGTTVIPLTEVNSIKVTGTLIKKVVIDTHSKKYKLQFKAMAIPNRAEQKNIVEKLAVAV